MAEDVSEVIGKLLEIEQAALTASAELPSGSIVHSRLRHIRILAKFSRMKLEGTNVGTLETAPGEGESSGNFPGSS
jgi:hypothetical protein